MSIDPKTTAETRRVVETLYRCGTSGDLPGALALVDENVELKQPTFLPYGGIYKGHEGFLRSFAVVVENYVDIPKLRILRLIVEGEHAFGILQVPAVKGGEVVFAEEFVVRNGKVVEITLYYYHSASIPLSSNGTGP